MPRPHKRSFRSSEEGLRSLGDQIKAAGSTRPAASTEGPDSLGEEIGRLDEIGRGRPGSATKCRRRRIRRGILVGLVVLLVVVGGGAGYVYYLAHDLQRVTVRGLHGAFVTGDEAGTENILMVGSTSRCALAKQNAAYGLCQGSANSAPVNGVNSDVIMILHADPAHHRLALLSIPRDLFIPNARSNGANKIDAGLFEGLTQLVAAIEEDFGIPIQHAISLNFDQFANIVDALSGINMDFPISLFDWGGPPPPHGTGSSGLNIQAAPCVHLNGIQALQVVRARHLRYKSGSDSSDPYNWTQEQQSDLARIRRDHEFLRVLATAVSKKGLGNPVADLNLIDSVRGDIQFDQTWPTNDIASLVLSFHSVNINAVPQLTLPVAEVSDPARSDGSYVYKGGGPYGDVEFPGESQDQGAIEQVLGIGANVDSMTGDPLPAPSAVTVSVMNGSGAPNQATDTSASLTALGFHSVGVGDTTPVGDVAETVVYYGSRAFASEAGAETVARSMSGSVIMAYDPNQVTDGAEVTVVTGTQFTVDALSTPTTGAASSSSSPVTLAPGTATSRTGAAIAIPSPTTSKLQRWDPRACPAGATPTAPVPNPT
jgi:LCP family protein required for cell wall assembly